MPDISISLLNTLQAIDVSYYSCIISYSTEDKKFADLIYTYLQEKNIQCWYAPHDMILREKSYEHIRVAIDSRDQVLLILSENSMQSKWVKTEIVTAKQQEDKKGKRTLFPVSLVESSKIQEWKLFDNDTGRDLAKQIREYHISSFYGITEEKTSYQNILGEIFEALNKVKA